MGIEVQKEKSRGDIWQFYGKSFVEDQLACESSFAAMVVRLDDDKKWQIFTKHQLSALM